VHAVTHATQLTQQIFPGCGSGPGRSCGSCRCGDPEAETRSSRGIHGNILQVCVGLLWCALAWQRMQAGIRAVHANGLGPTCYSLSEPGSSELSFNTC